MAHDGFARAIAPAHTPADGDTIFALATGAQPGAANVSLIGALAAEVMADAVVRAARRPRAWAACPRGAGHRARRPDEPATAGGAFLQRSLPAAGGVLRRSRLRARAGRGPRSCTAPPSAT